MAAGLLAVAILAGGCGAGDASSRRGDGLGTSTASPGGTPSPTATTTSTPESSDDRARRIAEHLAERAKCEPVRFASGTTGVPGGVYIFADTTPVDQWGPGCRLHAGDRCLVAFSGSYAVSGETAYVEFQAWLPRQTKPADVQLIGPLPATGTFQNSQFPYLIPKVEAVLFRLVLRDEARREVAAGDGWGYKVGCLR